VFFSFNSQDGNVKEDSKQEQEKEKVTKPDQCLISHSVSIHCEMKQVMGILKKITLVVV